MQTFKVLFYIQSLAYFLLLINSLLKYIIYIMINIIFKGFSFSNLIKIMKFNKITLILIALIVLCNSLIIRSALPDEKEIIAKANTMPKEVLDTLILGHEAIKKRLKKENSEESTSFKRSEALIKIYKDALEKKQKKLS